MDSSKHDVWAYFDASPEITVNEPSQEVICDRPKLTGLRVLSACSKEQPILAKRGDDLRVDWGRLYLAAEVMETLPDSIVATIASTKAREQFAANRPILSGNELNKAQSPESGTTVLAFVRDLRIRTVGSRPVSRWLMLAYDDEFSIQYFKKNLRPYWRRNGDDAAALLKMAAADYESLKKRCAAFDAELMADLTKAGGAKYAQLCALAYRQCFAANKLVADASGQPLMFPKENSSRGMISTVDAIYPMSPQFLLFSPSLMKAALVPILAYSSSARWPWPYAPHDLGTYPVANGQAWGGGEYRGQSMPVEETGNLLIMLGALAQIEGNADFCANYWPLVEKWAGYLKTNGFDPEEQMCTDDFTGALAHNANLSVKAICALGAFAKLCKLHGDETRAEEYSTRAKQFAERWSKEADDGDHYRLAFDQPGTWSQKYNLVWDRILGLNLFPDSVREKEMKFYRTRLDEFGLPLDNRETYTKLDWSLWTATLTQNRDDFDAVLNPIWRFINQTTNRVPISDWVWTQAPVPRGFQARPVVGGFFLQMLYDRAAWKKWASRDTSQPSNWAAILKPPKIVTVVPTAEKEPIEWHYTIQTPPDNWNKPGFDDSGWEKGPAAFGISGAHAATVRTGWNTPEIWLRREITLPEGKWSDLSFRLYLSCGVQIYLNGVLAATFPGYAADYRQVRVKGQARLVVRPGVNVIAVHAARTALAQCIDVGIVDVRDADD